MQAQALQSPEAAPARVLFVNWGREDRLAGLTLQLMRAVATKPGIEASLSVSRQSRAFADYEALGVPLLPVDTFTSPSGMLLAARRIPTIRRALADRIRRDRIEAVIELMPHIWSPLVMPAVRAAGARYCTLVHDANAHPTATPSLVEAMSLRALGEADVVVTLSSAVAGRLSATGRVPLGKLYTLGHPDLGQPAGKREPPAPGEPWRLLFLGRIQQHKGLPLFLDTIEVLRGEGLAVDFSVMGAGPVGPSGERIRGLGGGLVNRWLETGEMAAALAGHHILVLAHTEASQSAVAAAALGSGMPVAATPVGGLVEQIRDGVNGSLALRADAQSLAAAVRHLADPQIYRATAANIVRHAGERSMARFAEDLVALARYAWSDFQGGT